MTQYLWNDEKESSNLLFLWFVYFTQHWFKKIKVKMMNFGSDFAYCYYSTCVRELQTFMIAYSKPFDCFSPVRKNYEGNGSVEVEPGHN